MANQTTFTRVELDALKAELATLEAAADERERNEPKQPLLDAIFTFVKKFEAEAFESETNQQRIRGVRSVLFDIYEPMNAGRPFPSEKALPNPARLTQELNNAFEDAVPKVSEGGRRLRKRSSRKSRKSKRRTNRRNSGKTRRQN